jgi:hypothetical protein
VGDVQPSGNRLQTGERNDLRSLHGRDLLGVAGIALAAVVEQTLQAALAITLAGPPNRGFVTFQTSGDRTATLSSSNGQHNLGTSHFEPGQGIAMGNAMQSNCILASDDQFLWFSPTHEPPSDAIKGQTSA